MKNYIEIDLVWVDVTSADFALTSFRRLDRDFRFSIKTFVCCSRHRNVLIYAMALFVIHQRHFIRHRQNEEKLPCHANAFCVSSFELRRIIGCGNLLNERKYAFASLAIFFDLSYFFPHFRSLGQQAIRPLTLCVIGWGSERNNRISICTIRRIDSFWQQKNEKKMKKKLVGGAFEMR